MKEHWNLNHLLKDKTAEEWLIDAEKKAVKFENHRDKLDSKSSAEIQGVIKEVEEINKSLKRASGYYSLKSSEKTDDTEVLAKLSLISQKLAEIRNKTMFFELWFIGLDDDQAQKIIDEEKDYKYYLKTLRKFKKHSRTEEVEKILNIKSVTGGSAFADLYDVFTNSFEYEMNGERYNREELSAFIHSNDASEREAAYKELLKKYNDNGVVLSEIYKNIVLDWVNEGLKIRNYKTPISIRNLNNDIAYEDVDTMLRVVRKNIHLFTEYFELKHDMQAKDGNKYEFSRFHLYAPYNHSNKKYDYKTCKEKVLETYKDFDERFYNAAKEIFEKKHVHSHPQDKKRGGAFMSAILNEETPYIMLNHTNKLRDLFTMMHEFGHGIHYVFARKQVDLLYDSPLPMAETASIFGEMILASKLLEEAGKEEKASLLINLLDDQYASIGRQAYFTLFEKTAHEKLPEGSTKEELEEIWMNLLKEQFGKMNIPEEFKNEWNYIPHLHFSPFYCYAYSWGSLLVLSLYAMYKEEGKGFIDKYHDMLSEGGGKAPKELMLMVGADPSKEEFWQKGFDIIKKEMDVLKALSKEI